LKITQAYCDGNRNEFICEFHGINIALPWDLMINNRFFSFQHAQLISGAYATSRDCSQSPIAKSPIRIIST
jgi:hypothetical protein